MKNALCSLPIIIGILSLVTGRTIAQQQGTVDTGHAGGTKVHIGKDFSDREMNAMSDYYDSLNRQHIGKPYYKFEVTTTAGKTISSASCLGKVTLILFWMPTGGYSHIPPFNDLYDNFKSDTNFCMVSITPEGDLVKDFVKDHEVHFPIAGNDHYEECHTMNYHNGFPSFIVLNKAGIVAMVQKGGIGAQESTFTMASAELTAFLHKLLEAR